MLEASAITKSPVRSYTVVIASVLFFASGTAALLYQVAWQRTLFGWFGVDLDAVSIIVSVFMLGLGGGAMLGGWLSDRFPTKRILMFALIEMTIGLFGLVSLNFMDWAGVLFSSASLPALVGLALILFAVPTLCMGATLPILVTELVRRSSGIGQITGWLYFANTLGASLGAFAAGYFILSYVGLDGLVNLAAAINIAAGATAFLTLREGAR